jgi:(4S)-4-hydroxy-5-phosphonooxypentane-2,3-dione isomerase
VLVILVHCHVKPEFVDAFREACLDNASNSIQEAGVARFDVLQQADDPARFLLYEAYRTPDGHARHRETGHYARWRDTVADMMIEARVPVRYESRFLPDALP